MTDTTTKIIRNDAGSYNVENLNWYEIEAMVVAFPFMMRVIQNYKDKAALPPPFPTEVGSVIKAVDTRSGEENLFVRLSGTPVYWYSPAEEYTCLESELILISIDFVPSKG